MTQEPDGAAVVDIDRLENAASEAKHNQDHAQDWLAHYLAHWQPTVALALLSELRAHRAEKAPPVYPDTLPDGQRVMQPAPSVRAVVSPSGYVARIYDGRLGEYERLVRYVLAPLPAPPKGQEPTEGA